MKSLLLFFISFFLVSGTGNWITDFDQAQKIAGEKHKLILLNFSGSDWCGPCIRLKKEIFDSEAFIQYAGNHLVLVNADFPRLSKHQPSAEQVKQNEKLAEKYNPHGHFPFTLLLSADGKVLKSWDGLPDASPESFVNTLTLVSHDAD